MLRVARSRSSSELVRRCWVGRALLTLVLACLCAAAVGCGGSSPTPPAESPDSRGARSQAALDQLVGRDDGPGCSAAVADRGTVVWEGSRGLADVDKREAITSETRFEIAAVSKQFTAIGILLLEQAGQLSMSDRLSKHLHGMPDWADRVTLAQLMHQVSGVPDYFGSLDLEGEPARLNRDQLLAQIARTKKLEFRPGTKWEYSNSNYILLSVVIERVTGQSIREFLGHKIFEPLQLRMVADPNDASAGTARSYRPDGAGFETVDWHFYVLGTAGIQSTPTDLVRWADNYRSGTVGGPALLSGLREGAEETGFDSSRYGAGISSCLTTS